MTLFAETLKRNWLTWLILGFLFVFSGYYAVRELWRWLDLRREFIGITKETVSTSRETQELKKELENINNPVVLEKEARAKLNLKKEGESVLVVISEEDFPKEDFLEKKPSLVVSRGSLWFNIKDWQRYFFPSR